MSHRRVVTWSPDMQPIGPSVVAIGVFDGVHLGHQELLRDTARHAHRIGAEPVALTFDRDPDQIVTPASAAPQLLTLADKCAYIAECGIDTVLVVPFTPEVAAMPAEEFLDNVLGSCCTVRAIHVGEDFRFGARASGDIDTLYVWVAEHDADLEPHKLVTLDGLPVTSTRVRALVAAGDVEEAAGLLGRYTRVSGTVHKGREQGKELGFATANVEPVEFAAVPGPGVYAGYAVLPSGSYEPAAISSGRPPSFPEATDVLEAHLIDYSGDLYGRELTLEFVARIRDQRAFGSGEALSAAIENDVAEVRRILGDNPDGITLDDDDWIEDQAALDAAEKAVSVMDPVSDYDATDEEWVELAGPRRLSGVFGDAGFTAAIVSAPLDAAGIPHAWDPYPPEQMPGWRAGYGAVDRPFTLLVPASRLEEARAVMRASGMKL